MGLCKLQYTLKAEKRVETSERRDIWGLRRGREDRAQMVLCPPIAARATRLFGGRLLSSSGAEVILPPGPNTLKGYAPAVYTGAVESAGTTGSSRPRVRRAFKGSVRGLSPTLR